MLSKEKKTLIVQPTIVGKVIKRLRKEKGLTQAILAGLAEMDASHLKDMEAGRHSPNLDSLFHIAEALEIPASTLIAKIEEELKKERNL